MLIEHLTETPRDWDRGETVGASEIGGCARRAAYVKHHAEPDADHEETWGMRERGHWVEAWAVSRWRANGVELHEAGDDQVTRSAGFLSATADGYVDDVSIDVKSFDPRKTKIPEPAHIMQVRLGARLNPATTQGLLIYINASDFEDRREFGPYPQLTDDEFASLTARARDIMAKDPEQHDREGYFDDECSRFNCPFRVRCIGRKIEGKRDLSPENMAKLAQIQAAHAVATAKKNEGERERKIQQEEIRKLFQAAGTRIVSGHAWISRQTRDKLDTDAMERDGIDVFRYTKSGQPFDTITIKPPTGD